MPTLEEIQERINIHDDVLFDALRQRLQLTRQERKKAPNIDPAREAYIKNKARSFGEGHDTELREDFERFATHVLGIIETMAARYPLP